MAERKFDYQEIAEIYKQMQDITGDKGDMSTSTIAGLLNTMDKDVHENVNEENQAVFGELGSQLLLDWENTSSNFDAFVSNFENWSALIAKSAGEYGEFERRVSGFKDARPLGMTAVDSEGKGLTSNYIENSAYREYTNENFDELAGAIENFKDYNGLSYVDTNRVELEKNRETAAAWALGINALSTGLSVVGGSGIVKAEAAAGKTVAFWANANSASAEAASAASSAAGEAGQAVLSASDKAAAKVLGLSDDMLAELAMEGGTPSQLLQTTLGESAVGATASKIGAAASASSNSAAARILGLTDDVVAELASEGITPLQYAASLMSGGASNAAGAISASASQIASAASSGSNAAAARILGLTDEMVEALALEGVTPLQYAASLAGDAASGTSGAIGMLAGSHPNIIAGAGTAVNVVSGLNKPVTVDGTTYNPNPYANLAASTDSEEIPNYDGITTESQDATSSSSGVDINILN